MVFGKLKYHVAIKIGRSNPVSKTLRLTLVGSRDEDILSALGLSELRKKRIVRLTSEAEKQGLLLSYEDLNALLLSSVSTIKRDVNALEKQGHIVPIKGKRSRELR